MNVDKNYFAQGFLNQMSLIYDLEKVAMYEPENFADRLGDKLAEGLANAMAFGAVKAMGNMYTGGKNSMGPKLGPFQKKFIKRLMKSDSILKGRPPARVMSHYTTLASLAPSIAKDPNTVASFLRTSTAYDTIDTVMIKTLIDIESGYRERSKSDLNIMSTYTKKGMR